MADEPFAALVRRPAPELDRLALAMAAELRPTDAPAALVALDALGAELAAAAPPGSRPAAQAEALTAVLAERHGFAGGPEPYAEPELSMLDAVLRRRRGLPILLSVVYVAAARRAGWPVWGVGLAGHFVVGHFGAGGPLLLDPFRGGAPLPPALAGAQLRPWSAHETVARMLSNLVHGSTSRMDLPLAIRAAELRVLVPAPAAARERVQAELRALRARLN
jgi:regulator of sirC expression with transglutaminase-like and TPR domain